MKALVVANGQINNVGVLKKIEKNYDFILAVDGGTNYCMAASILPDCIIGDLDSISEKVLNVSKKHKIPIEKFPVKKDSTDTELSLDYLIKKGFKDITLIGAIGSRMDHTLGNILLLNKLKENKIRGKIINENNRIYLVEKDLVLKREENTFVSIIPIVNSGIMLSLNGFEYELDHEHVRFASTFCISNEIVKEKGTINIHKGKALVVVSKD